MRCALLWLLFAQVVSGSCEPEMVCPDCHDAKASTCHDESIAPAGKCDGCPGEVTNFLCSTKVADRECGDDSFADPNSKSRRTPFELCIWGFNHGGQCEGCNRGPRGNSNNLDVTTYTCAKRFKPRFRYLLTSRGSFECRYARYWTEKGGRDVWKEAESAGHLWAKAKAECPAPSFREFYLKSIVDKPYQVCIWGWNAGGYCTQSATANDWNNLNASASNGCSKELYREDYEMRDFSDEPTTAALEFKSMGQTECPPEEVDQQAEAEQLPTREL